MATNSSTHATRWRLGALLLMIAGLLLVLVGTAMPKERAWAFESSISESELSGMLADGEASAPLVAQATADTPTPLATFASESADPAADSATAEDGVAPEMPVPAATNNPAIIYGVAYYSDAFELLSLINQQRAANSVRPLYMNSTLLDNAMDRAAECTVVYCHTRPNGSNWTTINSSAKTEIISRDVFTARDLLSDMMRNMRSTVLNPDFTTIGIGCFMQNDVPFWTLLFASGSDRTNCSRSSDTFGGVSTDLTKNAIYIDTNQPRYLNPTISTPIELAQDEGIAVSARQTNPAYTKAEAVLYGFRWTSSNSNIVTADWIVTLLGVEEHGLIGVNPGSATINGQLSAFSYRATATVLPGIPIYRVFNPYTNEHLYTTNFVEAAQLFYSDWDFEGVAWRAPKSSSSPVMRLYNPNNGDHHYTTDRNEYNTLVRNGWRGEDTKFYSAGDSDRPIYRLFNPNNTGAGNHHYTLSDNERATLVRSGWRDEGIKLRGMW